MSGRNHRHITSYSAIQLANLLSRHYPSHQRTPTYQRQTLKIELGVQIGYHMEGNYTIELALEESFESLTASIFHRVRQGRGSATLPLGATVWIFWDGEYPRFGDEIVHVGDSVGYTVLNEQILAICLREAKRRCRKDYLWVELVSQ